MRIFRINKKGLKMNKMLKFIEEINSDYFWKEQFQVLGIVIHHVSLLLN